VWRKHLALTSICFFVFLSNYITSSVNPILIKISTDFSVSITKASWLITFNLLFLGIGNLFWIPMCNKIGKRPVLLLCTGIFFVSSIWSAVAKDWGSLFGARIVQGFGASASEALGPAIVADLYFLHERGLWVGVYTLMIAVGSALGSVFSGLIVRATLDWRWVFWMNVTLTGVCFLAALLFQAETNFRRPVEYETGEGLEQFELASIRTRANSTWAQSLSVTSWYERYDPSVPDVGN
jgi:MFS family permease